MSYQKVPLAPSAPGFATDNLHPLVHSAGSPPPPYPMPTPHSPYDMHSQGGYPTPPPSGPVLQQPAAQFRGDGWMTMPHVQTACPPGLEYLSTIDTLKVHQKHELAEIIFDYESNNKYHVLNGLGQIIYLAAEENDCCTRNCCGPIRPFNLNIMDNFGKTIIRLDRPLACQSCCFPCCLQTLEVSAPPGNVVGSVRQRWSFCQPVFDILDERGAVVLKITGPMVRMCGNAKFKVYSKDGSRKVGKITKEWGGILREAVTDADRFGITFPADLDVKIKAVLLGALFLIDYMYFEQ